MPKYNVNPIKKLAKVREEFSQKISQAENSTDWKTKIELAQAIIAEYHFTMATLSRIKTYNNNPHAPDITKLKDELRNQLDIATKIEEQSTKQLQLAEKKSLKEQLNSVKEKHNEIRAKKGQEAIKKIDTVLWNLNMRIGEISTDLPKARKRALNLYNILSYARDEYEEQLKNIDKDTPSITFDKAGEQFKQTCIHAIDKAMPKLEKDLGWGDYLKKALQTILNAIIYICTATKISGFFTHSKFNEVNQAQSNVHESGRKLLDIDTSEPTTIFSIS